MKDLILKSLCYFDIFNHPLNKDELLNICGIITGNDAFEALIKDLCSQSAIYTYQGYYSISPQVQSQVKERQAKEELAKGYIKKLPFYAKIIKSFPFVRGISVSGSLSKGVMYEDGDIDYFIITQKNRLWICRTLLVLFKKTFLFNSRKYFCVNYFVDEDNLEIIDKNIFTAIEISYLAPVYNANLIHQMKEKNAWVKSYIPHYSCKEIMNPLENSGPFKQLIEGLFFDRFANWLDLQLMSLTFRRWKKKFKNFNPEKLELTMRSNRGVSKHHPSDFQTKVLKEYQDRISQLKIAYESPVHA